MPGEECSKRGDRAAKESRDKIAWLLIQQMLYAGIDEEPFFRGFLWGTLRRAGWKEVWVMVVPYRL